MATRRRHPCHGLARLVFGLALLTTAGACDGDGTPTQVIVIVEADPGQLAAGPTFRPRVFDTTGALRLDRTAPAAELQQLPLRARDDDASRTYHVVAELVGTDGCVTARQVARGSYSAGEQLAIRLRFDDACASVACGLDQTCIEGECQDACFLPQALDDTTRSTPMPCADRDAGTPDGPVISDLQDNDPQRTSVEIEWNLSPPGTGQTFFGDSYTYGQISTFEPGFLERHSQRIVDLTPDTTYHYRVQSSDATGRTTTSLERCFHTLP